MASQVKAGLYGGAPTQGFWDPLGFLSLSLFVVIPLQGFSKPPQPLFEWFDGLFRSPVSQSIASPSPQALCPVGSLKLIGRLVT